MDRLKLLPQRQRLLLLCVYVLLLCVLSGVVLGNWLPPFDERGLWFYAGLFAFLTGALLEAPTHSTPAQSLTFAAFALVAIVGFGLGARAQLDRLAWAVFWIALLAEGVVATTAVASIVWKDAGVAQARGRLGQTGYVLTTSLGRPDFVALPPFVFALFGFHRHNAAEVLGLALGWILLVFIRPLERSVVLIQRLRSIWSVDGGATHVGEVIGHGVPGLVTIRHGGAANVEPGTPLIVPGDDGRPNLAVALNYVGVANGLWLRAMQLDLSDAIRNKIPRGLTMAGTCARLKSGPLLRRLEASGNATLQKRLALAGIVAPGTDSGTLLFELVRYDQEMEEGQLLEVEIAGKPVLYQLLDGITREDVLQQKSTRGFVLGKARKVGYWNPHAEQFEPVRWVPAPNTPVFLPENDGLEEDPTRIGTFPGTDYPVRVQISDLVTHNAAILGILGIGKTFLALELVERMLLEGVRVICLDLTDQYDRELAPYLNERMQAKVIAHLQAVGKSGKTNVKKNVEEGGSVGSFSNKVSLLVKRFLDPERDHRLIVINPNMFEVWRQDSKPYQGEASMASLTAAEITRIITEAALDAVQQLGMADGARCCLVYEEAHSLVPEWTAVAYEGDKAAANGTARAILQGRKYGLGCLVVTQRTASVTKTVLNQCNTVFAMRVFDATGMEFLSNYIGKDYANVLSGLGDRHTVVFGKASSCADPVLVRVNERAAFLASVRDAEAATNEVPSDS